MTGTVVAALEGELAGFPAGARDSTLAAAALALAREIDVPGNSATSKALCARALNETLDKLRALVPEEPEADKVDELRARRAKRRSGSPKAAS